LPRYATIGIDIGGTKTLFALFDERFKLIPDAKVPTDPAKGEVAFAQKLTQNLGVLFANAQHHGLEVMAIGAGSAGVIDRERGIVRECLSIPFLNQYPLRSRLEALTNTHVAIANDVAAGLYGEQQLGAAVGYRHVLGFFFGTGLGGAIMIDGRIHEGAIGRAGDVGHYVLHSMGRGRHETLDNAASRTAIAGEAAALAAKQQAPHLLRVTGTDVQDIKGHDLSRAIHNGDTVLEELVRSRLRLAGMAISNLVDFFNPEMVVLGGGLVEALPQIALDEVTEALDAYCVYEVAETTRVATARLGDHAVACGAAKLALDAVHLKRRRLGVETAMLHDDAISMVRVVDAT
jgi:glucokinase